MRDGATNVMLSLVARAIRSQDREYRDELQAFQLHEPGSVQDCPQFSGLCETIRLQVVELRS